MSNTPQASPGTPEKSQNLRRRGVIRLVLSLVLMAVSAVFPEFFYSKRDQRSK